MPPAQNLSRGYCSFSRTTTRPMRALTAWQRKSRVASPAGPPPTITTSASRVGAPSMRSFAGKDHPVAALVLGAVERFIGAFDEVGLSSHVELGRRDSQRCGHRRQPLVGFLEGSPGDGAADTFGDDTGRGGRRFGRQKDELLASEKTDHIRRANPPLDRNSNLDEHP